MKKLTTRDQTTEFLLYTAPNGGIKVEVRLSHETIWLTQKRMAELFGVGVAAISPEFDSKSRFPPFSPIRLQQNQALTADALNFV